MRTFTFAFVFILLSTAAHAQFQRILGPTNLNWTFFGESVSMHGNFAIVGEPNRDANGLIHEKAHVYKLGANGWTRRQTFLSAAFTGENDLGGRTGMSENWLAFSQISGTSSFKYFLYQKQADTFALKQTIAHPDPWNHNFVCKTIALTDEHLIVGGAGSAFCYRINATTGLWELKQTLTKGGEFGSSAAVWQNRAVICSNLANTAYAFEFQNGTWVERSVLTPNNVAANHQFGANCAIYNDLIAVTDFGGSYNTHADTSKAYIYKWQPNGQIGQIADLKSPNNHDWSNFGGSYYFNDDFLLVGANTDFQTGKVFKYRRNGDTFQYVRSYRNPDDGIQPTFGESIAAYGNQLLISDPSYGNNRGAIYQGYVYDSLYAVVDCQLPAQINGNQIDSTNLQDLFTSDAAAIATGKPAKFGVINVHRLFNDMEPVEICEYSVTSDTTILDYTQGYTLLTPENMYARWTTQFQYNGQTYTASDLLDDTTAYRPKVVRTFPVGVVTLDLEFGRVGEAPCKVYPLELSMHRIICNTAVDTVDMMAGDTITLAASCNTQPNPPEASHYWWSEPQDPRTIGVTFNPTASVFPLENTVYYCLVQSDVGLCSAERKFFVRVTATDADQDGFPFFQDCDDNNAAVNPTAIEIMFNGIDDDCIDGDDGFCLQRQPGALQGKDAMVQSDSTNINAGNQDDLNVAYHSSWNPVKHHQAYLRFQLDNIPRGAIIDSAFLSLYWNPNDGHGVFGTGHFDGTNNPGSAQLVLDRVTQNWSQSTLNWTNKPLISTTNRVTVSHALYPGGTSNFTHMDVTKLVRDMLDTTQTGNHGLRMSILPLNNVRQLIFASSNHQNAALRPKLELCWHGDTTTNYQEVYTNALVAVYPNPATHTVVIETEAPFIKSYQLYNALGQVQLEGTLLAPKTLLNTRNMEQGKYYLRFDDGSVRSVLLVRE